RGHLEEAGAALARGVGDHASPSRDRRADRRALRVLRRRRPRDPPPSRALGRLRLPRRPRARDHPPGGAYRRRRRRLRRAHLRALLPSSAHARGGARPARGGGRAHARRAGGGGAPRRARAGGALSVYAIARPWEPRPGGLLSGAPLPLLVALGVLTAGAGALARAELVPLTPARALGAGGAQGALLGAHLFVTASLTLGYSGRVPTLEGLAPWLAYDVGGNVLTTEAFFRGALFDRAQRRWPFPAAAALVTALCLVRYLVDPLLPRSLEVTAGAVFYLTLLSLANCWLYWRSGSIAPGVAAGVVFFVAYRLLHVVP